MLILQLTRKRHKVQLYWDFESKMIQLDNQQEIETDLDFLLMCLKDLCCAKKHSSMSIMSTTVHFPWNLTLVFPLHHLLLIVLKVETLNQ